MNQKELEFSVNKITIDDRQVKLSDFRSIPERDLDQQEIGSGKDKEVLSAKETTRDTIENRFLCISFEEGSKYPYPAKVYDIKKSKKVKNPRSVNQIEFTSQIFLLIDIETSRLYVSDQRKRTAIISWLSKIIDKVVSPKAIIEEKEFISSIESIKEITFAVEQPNLFNSVAGTLGSELIKDINGYEAEEAVVTLKYKKHKFSDELKRKVNDLIGWKNQFKDLTIVGRTDEYLSSILNIDGIINKISINIEPDEITKKFDKDLVFSALVKIIKKSQ